MSGANSHTFHRMGPADHYTEWTSNIPEVVDATGETSYTKVYNKTAGLKYDDGKPDLTFLNPEAQAEIARAFGYGAQKYARYNYRKGMNWLRIAAAALRHINSWAWGEDNDKESGLNHLAHAGACIYMLLDYVANNLGTDDRPKKETNNDD